MNKIKFVVGIFALQLFLMFGLGAADKANLKVKTTIQKSVLTDVNKETTRSSPVKYFSPIIQLENEAMKSMFELAGLKEALKFKIAEFAINQTFGSKKELAKKNPWQMDKILFWGTPLPTSDPAIAELSSVIAEKDSDFKKVEANIDSKYNEFINKLKTYKSMPGSETDKDYIKTLLLYMTTQFRRGVGDDLHTELAGLINDPDCASDLVSNQPFLKYGVYSLDEKFAHAITTLVFMRQQVGCISSSQLAIADFYSFETVEKTFALISDSSLKQWFADLTFNPLLIIYDAGKSQFSRGMDYINEHIELVMNSYNKNSILYKLGFYLPDETNFMLTEIKFGDKAPSYAPDPKTYALSEVTTPFGMDTGFLKEKWCGVGKNIPEKSFGQSPSWDGFIESAGDPSFIGFGADSMKNTIVFGVPDVTGICDGGGGAGGNGSGGGGSITCGAAGGGGGGMQVLKVCHVMAPPTKNPPPAEFNVGGSSGAKPSTGVINTKTASKTFSYKNSFSCPGGSKTNPDDEKTETPVKATNEMTNKQDQNKNKGSADGNKKKDDLANAAESKATDKEKADAAKKADAAVKNAKTANGLKAQTTGGKTTWYEDSNSNDKLDSGEKTFGQGKCGGCQEGTTDIDGVTIQHSSDGSIEIVFESGSLANGSAGMTGADIVKHEWAHAYYYALGVKSSHHNKFTKANVKYCTASGDECSAGCSAGQIMMATYYDCPESSSWSSQQGQESCGNAPVMPGGAGGVNCPGGGGLFDVKTSADGESGSGVGISPLAAGMAFPGQVNSTPCEGLLTDSPDICVFAECMIEKMPICGGEPLCSAGGGAPFGLFKWSKSPMVTDPSPIMTKLPVWMQEQYKQGFKKQGTPAQQGGKALPQKK